MYRKLTLTDHYLQRKAHRHQAHKRIVAGTLFHQVETHIKHNEKKKVEKIMTDVRRYGYLNWAFPKGQFKKNEKTTVQREHQEVEKKPRRKYIVLP